MTTAMTTTPSSALAKNPKVILITGVSSGFGKIATELLLARGHTVLAGLRGGEERLNKIFAAELTRYGSSRLRALDMHMEKPETFNAAIDMINKEFGGKLDVLVNNAGYALFGALEDQTEEQLRYQMEVNYFGPLLLAKRFLPQLKAARGRVLNVSSICGLVTFPYYGAYNAAKHALDAHAEAMHYDLKPHGVQVASIEPGGFKTDFTSAIIYGKSSEDPQSPNYKRTVNFKRNIAEKSSMGGKPIRVGKLIVKLCEKPKIPLRNLIGIDAQFMFFAKRAFPEGMRVAAEDLIFRKAFFSE